MLLDIILWIAFGALAGWIGSKIMNTDARMGAVANIVVGVLGAFVGGFLFRTITGSDVSNFSIGGLLVAILGAVILIAIAKFVTRAAADGDTVR